MPTGVGSSPSSRRCSRQNRNSRKGTNHGNPLISTHLPDVTGAVASVEHTVRPSAHCRYLMGLYYGTWPWLREFVNASRLGLPAIKLWAYDQVCLFGWPVPLPTTDDCSFIY